MFYADLGFPIFLRIFSYLFTGTFWFGLKATGQDGKEIEI